jgi:hypothetical protein
VKRGEGEERGKKGRGRRERGEENIADMHCMAWFRIGLDEEDLCFPFCLSLDVGVGVLVSLYLNLPTSLYFSLFYFISNMSLHTIPYTPYDTILYRTYRLTHRTTSYAMYRTSRTIHTVLYRVYRALPAS